MLQEQGDWLEDEIKFRRQFLNPVYALGQVAIYARVNQPAVLGRHIGVNWRAQVSLLTGFILDYISAPESLHRLLRKCLPP